VQFDFLTGAWGMDFVSSSPLFSKFSYKSFLRIICRIIPRNQYHPEDLYTAYDTDFHPEKPISYLGPKGPLDDIGFSG
jgi:hypothetical protein